MFFRVPEFRKNVLVTKKYNEKNKLKKIKLSEAVDENFQEAYGPTPEWAKLDRKKSLDEDEDSDNEFYNPKVSLIVFSNINQTNICIIIYEENLVGYVYYFYLYLVFGCDVFENSSL